MNQQVTNVVIGGLGGQGVLRASDILADVVLRAGYDVKKSELHGMSQRGGSVSCDVRFGAVVHSPMVPAGEADYLLVLTADQVEPNRHVVRSGGIIILPDQVDSAKLLNRKSLNVALLGLLSSYLPLPEELWMATIREQFPEKLHAANEQAFKLGRAARV
jgi:indolepyruvate ferredoxin oxidoreductase beta subunit